jgi:vancomycin resistance protein VanJ
LRLFTLASAAYALAVLAAWAVDGLWPGRVWPATFAMLVLPWLLLPTIAALPVALAARHRWTAVVLAIAVGLFVTGYGELFLPRPAIAEGVHGDATGQLRLMTWNLGPEATPHAGLADAIRAADADVVALQELDAAEAQALEARLAVEYPYRILLPVEHVGYTGKGLLSRYPIQGHAVLVITDRTRPHLQADIDVAGDVIRILNVHPHPPPHLPAYRGDGTFREHPVTNADLAVLGRMAVEAEPAILLGDLNSTPRSTAVRALRQTGLRDAFQDAGWGLGATWPSSLRGLDWRLPLIRIDYVWHTPAFRATRAWAAPGIGTDHRPVVVDLRW